MLIVIAEKEELKLIKEVGLKDHPILITGVGGANVIKALRNLPKNIPIINVGYCGSNYYEQGKILAIDSVKTYYKTAQFKEDEIKLPILWTENINNISKCYTSTDFVTETDIKEPCVFDMELAFICSMFDNVRSIKVVSDNLNKEDYEKNIKKI